MTEQVYFSCDDGHKPLYKITFSIDDTEKTYFVCADCAVFDYFSKYIIKKEKITSDLVTNGVEK